MLTVERLALRGAGRPTPRASERMRLVSLRLDEDVLDALRANEPGWWTRINDARRQAIPQPPNQLGRASYRVPTIERLIDGRPINAAGVGRWRDYARQLAPIPRERD